MSQFWIAPLVMVLLCLGWFAVQQAWLRCMGRAADADALERPGYCGTACACRADCPRKPKATVVESNQEER